MSAPSLRVRMDVVYEAEMSVAQFEHVAQVIQLIQSINPNAEIGVTTQAAPTTRRPRQTARTNGGPATGDPPLPPASVSSVSDVQTPPDTVASDQAQDEGDEEFGLASTSSLSPEEEREKALGICRNVYNADHREPIRALRKQFGVTKFPDIPLEQAHEFLRAAEAMAQKVGMRV